MSNWMIRAACRDAPDPELWFSGDPAAAIRVCGRCPVQERCAQEAEADPDIIGVWGGISWDARAAAAEEAARLAEIDRMAAMRVERAEREALWLANGLEAKRRWRAEWAAVHPQRPAGKVVCPVCSGTYRRHQRSIVVHLRRSHPGYLVPHLIDVDDGDLCSVCHSGPGGRYHLDPGQHEFRAYLYPTWDASSCCAVCNLSRANAYHTDKGALRSDDNDARRA